MVRPVGMPIQKAVALNTTLQIRRPLAAAGASVLTLVLVARTGASQLLARSTTSGRALPVTTCNLGKAAEAAVIIG